jgi:hypothetical protein
MTVSELIEELQRHPAHYRVFVEHLDLDSWGIDTGRHTEWASVADVRVDDACTVIIDATEGVK